MARYFKIAVVVIVVGLWVLANHHKPAAFEGLVVSPAEVDLGVAVRGAGQVDTHVSLSNRAHKPLALELKLTCGCARAYPEELTLEPGATQDVRVAVTPPGGQIPYTVGLLCQEKGTGEILGRANVHGQTVAWVAADVQAVQLEVTGEHGKEERTLKVRNHATRPFDGRLALSGDAAAFVALGSPRLSLAPGETGTVTLTAGYPGRRRLRGQLDITEGRDDEPVERLELVLTGLSPYLVDPPALLWEAKDTPAKPLAVQVSRRDAGPFSLVGARLDPPADWLAVDPGGEGHGPRRVSLRVTSTERHDPYRGELVVQAAASGQAETVRVRVIAKGSGS